MFLTISEENQLSYWVDGLPIKRTGVCGGELLICGSNTTKQGRNQFLIKQKKIKEIIEIQKHKNTTQVGHTQQSRKKLVLNKNEKQKNIQIQKYKITKQMGHTQQSQVR